jgi:hypothetical protein
MGKGRGEVKRGGEGMGIGEGKAGEEKARRQRDTGGRGSWAPEGMGRAGAGRPEPRPLSAERGGPGGTGWARGAALGAQVPLRSPGSTWPSARGIRAGPREVVWAPKPLPTQLGFQLPRTLLCSLGAGVVARS